MGCADHWGPYQGWPEFKGPDVINLLCEAVAVLGLDALKNCSVDLQEWARQHADRDAARIKVARANAEHQRAKDTAMAKLTPEERRILGVRE